MPRLPLPDHAFLSRRSSNACSARPLRRWPPGEVLDLVGGRPRRLAGEPLLAPSGVLRPPVIDERCPRGGRAAMIPRREGPPADADLLISRELPAVAPGCPSRLLRRLISGPDLCIIFALWYDEPESSTFVNSPNMTHGLKRTATTVGTVAEFAWFLPIG